MSKINSFFSSFRAAGKGIAGAVLSERNLRFHLGMMLFVLYFKKYFSFNATENAVLFLTIGMVIAAELVNTAIERAVDLCCPQQHPLAAQAKDTAAGAVLVTAIAAVLVGVNLFWKPQVLKEILRGLVSNPLRALILLLALVLWGWFVFCFEETAVHNRKKE